MSALRDLEVLVYDRVNAVVKFSVTRYVLSIGIFVAIVAFGVLSAVGLGVDLLPTVNVPSVNVSVSYPGAAPSVIDQQVVQVLENAVSTLSGITDLNSSSSVGSGRVGVTFGPGMDKNVAMNQVASLVNASIRRLPAGAGTPVVRTFDANAQPVLQFGVSGGGASLASVAEYVENILSPSLERIEGVANIQVDGAPARQFRVLLDPNRLRHYNVSPQQVVGAIGASAVNQPIGSILTQGSSLSFSTRNVPESLEAVGKILVDAGRGLAVGDLGAVRDASVDSNIARIDGVPVVLVSIQRTTDSNSVAVVDGVRKLLAATTPPAGYAFRFGNDSTGPIRSSVESTYRELMTSLIVVALIVLLSLGKPDTAFAVILAIPISLAAAPILYRFMGFSFNLVSLLAMVTAIGIVVDDSIVVAENVERYRGMGFGHKESVLRGGSEVFTAVVASTLSLLAVLLPVSFVSGYVGRYLTQFALGLAAAVGFSMFEALLFLTVRMAYGPDRRAGSWADLPGNLLRFGAAFRGGFASLKKGWAILLGCGLAGAILYAKKYAFLPLLLAYPLALGLLDYLFVFGLNLLEALSGSLYRGTNRALEFVQEAYGRSLRRAVRRSAVVLAVSGVGLAVAAVLLVPKIPFSFVPQSDSGSMQVTVRFPQGTPQGKANEAAARLEAFLLARPEVATVQTVVGGSAECVVSLVPKKERPTVFALAPEYRRLIQPLLKDFPSVRLSVGTGGGGGGGGGSSSLQLSLTSPDFRLLLERNAAIIDAIQRNPFVADVSSGLSDTNLESRFLPDTARLKGTGITPQALATLLQTYTSGAQAANVETDGLAFPIRVQVDPTLFFGGQTLLDLPVYSPTLQTSLQVGQLGRFELAQSPNSIQRFNRQYSGGLNINLKPGAPTALEMQKAIAGDLKASGLLEGGISLSAGSRFGQAALATELATTGPLLFLLALFLTYLVMAAQFNSWRFPIYLLLPVPLALTGALIVVYAVGGGLDIFGVMGMIMLIGISSKTAILYLEFVTERLGKMRFVDALVEAGRLRFRPIVMTTLTTLVISFPLIFSGGQGAEFGQRMGVVMFGGIVCSTVLTLYVVPATFFLFERKRVPEYEEAPPGGASGSGAEAKDGIVAGENDAEGEGEKAGVGGF
ncbi:MAG: efflux RND transporter permease subunit [Spirochaetaceae bacterium]|nr:efflux RND transporter permease subunit [Spirochaetaceae bacterium]